MHSWSYQNFIMLLENQKIHWCKEIFLIAAKLIIYSNCSLFLYSQVRECLKLDPEHKECFPHYKKVKKVAKLVQELHTNANDNNYQGCVTSAKKVSFDAI